MLSFFVPGPPVGKARSRFVRRGFKGPDGRMRYSYPDPQSVEAEGNIALHASRAMNGKPLINEPVELRVIAYHLPPKSRSKSARSKPWSDFKCTRADVDNYVKSCMDALNGVVYVDDALVAAVHAAKVFGDKPGLQISVHPVNYLSWPVLGGVISV